MLQPEQRLELGTRKKEPPALPGFKRNQIGLNMPRQFLDSDEDIVEKLAAISAKKIDFKKLQFVEWLEFLCRLASCVFVFDEKTASRVRGAAE
mmetsp:Transcript_23652/g.31698  ORF Transcript_23652/g.31698 Transcript_23652/m.31698 type:complete len:93 (+) Transcript_23652:2300-2578(+)